MRNAGNRVFSFEDLEVFQRAYRVSLEIHKASLGFPKIEQYAMADQGSPRVEIDLREYRRRFCQAAPLCGRVPSLSSDGDRFGG